MPELPPPPSLSPSWRAPLEAALGRVAWARGPAGALAVLATAIVLGLVSWNAFRPMPPAPELTLPRASPTGSAGAPTEVGEDTLVVHAAGAVARPGVYEVRLPGRVLDVLTAAGGALPEADLDQLNLAARVSDGDRVYLPRVGESMPPPSGVGSASVGSSGGAGGAAAGPVNLNSATPAELDALPGVGPATAKAIVDHRTQKGRFASVDDLLSVRGIGEAKMADLRDKVRV